MRLMLVASDFPNPYEPTKGIFNLHLARALAQEHDVRVISPISWVDEWRARRAGTAAISGARSALVHGLQVDYPSYYYPPKVLRSSYGWCYWRSVRRTVTRVLGEGRPDAVLGYWIHPDGEVAVRVARMAGAPAAVIVGGSDLLLLPNSRSRRRCVRTVLQAADAVVTVNQQLKQKVIEQDIVSDKVHVWHQGVETDKFCPGDRVAARRRLGIRRDGPVLLWVGRMVPVKGLDVLIRACSVLHTRDIAFSLYLVGDGPLQRRLVSQSAQLGLSSSVSFMGIRSHDELPDWYRAADLLVLPSRSEGLPNVLRESLACGTPFVATSVGGIPEIASEPRDRLVPPDDPLALADAIEGVLKERRARVRPHSAIVTWADSAKALVDLLAREIAERRRTAAPQDRQTRQLDFANAPAPPA